MHFKRDKEVRLTRSSVYWGFAGYFETAVIRIIEDDTARMTAGLAGQFDYVGGVPKTYIDTFDADPDFIVTDVGEDLCYFYLEIYSGPDVYSNGTLKPGETYQTQKNPSWLRRALALAINYTYIYDEIHQGYVYPGCPAIPRSMPGYNSSLEGKMAHNSTFEESVKMARDLMQSMGFGVAWNSTYPGTNEIDWQTASFRTLEVNQHYGSMTNQLLNSLLDTNWKLIGVDIVVRNQKTTRSCNTCKSYSRNTSTLTEVIVISYIVFCSWCLEDIVDKQDATSSFNSSCICSTNSKSV